MLVPSPGETYRHQNGYLVIVRETPLFFTSPDDLQGTPMVVYSALGETQVISVPAETFMSEQNGEALFTKVQLDRYMLAGVPTKELIKALQNRDDCDLKFSTESPHVLDEYYCVVEETTITTKVPGHTTDTLETTGFVRFTGTSDYATLEVAKNAWRKARLQSSRPILVKNVVIEVPVKKEM